MSSVTLDVNAAVLCDLVKSGTWTLNSSNSSVTPNDINTTIPAQINTVIDDGIECTRWFYHVNFGTTTLVETETEYYAYKIAFTPGNISSFSSDALWTRYIVGTSGEVASDKGVYGVSFSKTNTPTVWYVTNGAEFSLRVALQSYFYCVRVEDSWTENNFTAKGTVNYKVYGYTKEEYEESIRESIDEGNKLQEENNDLQEEGNKLQEEANDLQKEENELQKEENETSKGILSSITDFFGSFFQNLIDSVIHIVVPTDEQVEEIINFISDGVIDRMGILTFPIQIISDFIDIFSNMSSDTAKIIFPEFSIMGYQVWGEYHVDLASNELASTIFEFVRMGTGIIILSAFLLYLQDFVNKHFGGGGS